MNYAQEALKQVLEYKFGIIALNLLVIMFCFVGKKVKKTYPYGIALLFVLAVNVALLVPFLKDYKNNNIVVEQGCYENLIGGRKSSFSHIVGTYGITLYTDNLELHLTTAPGKKDIFITGKYPVIAYYLPESKILLHIEFLE